MFKHVGKHNGKKVIIVFRENPETPGMASVLYSDALPQNLANEVNRLLESPAGQSEFEFGNLLHRTPASTSSGNTLLKVLAADRYIRQAPIKEVMVIPNNKSSIRLDELNKLLSQHSGENGVAELVRKDNEQGLKDSRKQTEATVLSDEEIANQVARQVEQMRAEASGLLAEADRMENELKIKEADAGAQESVHVIS